MTPAEAFGHARTTLPAAIDRVVAEGLGRADTRQQLAPYADRLRDAADLEQASALAQRVKEISEADPPVEQRLLELTQAVRDKAEAETIPGQVKQAAKDAGDAVKKTADTALTIVEVLAVGWVLSKLSKHLG